MNLDLNNPRELVAGNLERISRRSFLQMAASSLIAVPLNAWEHDACVSQVRCDAESGTSEDLAIAQREIAAAEQEVGFPRNLNKYTREMKQFFERRQPYMVCPTFTYGLRNTVSNCTVRSHLLVSVLREHGVAGAIVIVPGHMTVELDDGRYLDMSNPHLRRKEQYRRLFNVSEVSVKNGSNLTPLGIEQVAGLGYLSIGGYLQEQWRQLPQQERVRSPLIEQAKTWLSTAADLFPACARIPVELAVHAAYVGERERCLHQFEIAEHLDPHDPAILYTKVVVLNLWGDLEGAESCFTRTLSMIAFPQHQDLARALNSRIAVRRQLGKGALARRDKEALRELQSGMLPESIRRETSIDAQYERW